MFFPIYYVEVYIGLVQETWTVSEDIGELNLIVESDGLNVEPVIVDYAVNGTGTAQGLDIQHRPPINEL